MKFDAAAVLDQASWPVLLVDGAGVVCRANPTATSLFGALLQSDPLFSTIWVPDNGHTSSEFLARCEIGGVACTPASFRAQSGAVASYLTSVCSFPGDQQEKYLLVQLFENRGGAPSRPQFGDTTLVQKQKLDCALQLARTVSLDFNNALTTILGHTSLLLAKIEPDHPWRSSLLEVEKSADRAAEIASDLGTFSRQEKDARAQTEGNLNSLVQRSLEFCQKIPGADVISWSLQLERKPFTAKFDEAKMQQALAKILENSIQAVSGTGRISVLTRNVELAEATQDRNARLAAGAYACVEINDNGCGIAPEVLPRIFEPFFTTKQGPNHRGLGLAWVYGIVTNHGGGVAVSSQPGSGTSVRVYLPAEKRVLRDTGITSEDLAGNQTILIVDDEDLLLTMSQTVLSTFGYRVLTASNGQKALELLAKPNEPIDLVVTDLVMPTMSGRELVDHISRVSPRTRVLCTSGCIWPAGQQADAHYLQKPFTSQELLRKVKHSLCE